MYLTNNQERGSKRKFDWLKRCHKMNGTEQKEERKYNYAIRSEWIVFVHQQIINDDKFDDLVNILYMNVF